MKDIRKLEYANPELVEFLYAPQVAWGESVKEAYEDLEIGEDFGPEEIEVKGPGPDEE